MDMTIVSTLSLRYFFLETTISFFFNAIRLAMLYVEMKRENWLTYFTIGAFPTLYARLIAILVAGVMAEYVVPRPAELRAGRVVIMVRALDPNAIS